MGDIPDTIVLKRHRDLEGRGGGVWVRRTLMSLVAVIPILALTNLFGQRPETTTARTGSATLKVYAAARVRSGLLYEARFHVTAERDLRKAILVLSPGWLEGLTVNTIEPSPVNEGSANGRLSLELGHIPAGSTHLLFMQFQVNPTTVGHRDQSVWLYDGKQQVLAVHRTVTVFP